MSAPSPSLFVQNINDKVKKEELRRSLYGLFSLYGKVIDVVHTRDPAVRGTAFVVFRDLASSTSAMRGLDGESFFGKQLKISYSKTKSHATTGLEEGPEAVYAIKAGLRTAAEKAASGTSRLTVSGAQKKLIDEAKKAKRGRESDEEEEDEDDEDGPGEKKKDKKDDGDDDDAMEEESDDEAPAPAPGPAAPAQGSEPNPILFIEGVPSDATADMLSTLFQQYPGLSSLKLLPTPAGSPPNSGSGFVQYETAAQAGLAKTALDQFLLAPTAPLRVSWAKRA
ncbi:hypothetical protein RQP46_003037 [Phenoliferia psychrophenolica]